MNNKISELHQLNNEESYHENPLLKLLKISKKEKQQTKSNNFVQKLTNKVTFNTSNSISKSSLRRRKRKEKEELKPKMNELLLNLPEETTKLVDNTKTNTFIKTSKQNLNRPNPQKITGQRAIFAQESKSFTNVLKNTQFKSSPFDALKNAIKQNLDNN